MVDINDLSALPSNYNESVDLMPQTVASNLIDDEDMEQLAYSESESTAIPEDEFVFASDSIPIKSDPITINKKNELNPTPNENGKL